MQAYRETIEQICHLSEEMLNHSQQNEWEDVASVEQKRQLMLSQLSSIEMKEFDAASEKLLQKVISINADIEALSRKEMDSCQKEYNEVKNNKSAINAYSSF